MTCFLLRTYEGVSILLELDADDSRHCKIEVYPVHKHAFLVLTAKQTVGDTAVIRLVSQNMPTEIK